ncbi:hypothetical protein H696_04925 [Fonticula alba]|uniref:Ubiquitin-like protease family profile domain-containing protein n=1 Tax=Fonticula alba TaxID=691883 RepID=A0A058Z2Z7_FONAL|nr:hypothetical protein H696_04925 [Fonticula alba]KCV68635.1 hypothetical protein H696_04925 [Fonticula alba]|eukprot:XP_009497067.1 hypothetical protein H696_04925 [Fonticula alba]
MSSSSSRSADQPGVSDDAGRRGALEGHDVDLTGDPPVDPSPPSPAGARRRPGPSTPSSSRREAASWGPPASPSTPSRRLAFGHSLIPPSPMSQSAMRSARGPLREASPAVAPLFDSSALLAEPTDGPPLRPASATPLPGLPRPSTQQMSRTLQMLSSAGSLRPGIAPSRASLETTHSMTATQLPRPTVSVPSPVVGPLGGRHAHRPGNDRGRSLTSHTGGASHSHLSASGGRRLSLTGLHAPSEEPASAPRPPTIRTRDNRPLEFFQPRSKRRRTDSPGPPATLGPSSGPVPPNERQIDGQQQQQPQQPSPQADTPPTAPVIQADPFEDLSHDLSEERIPASSIPGAEAPTCPFVVQAICRVLPWGGPLPEGWPGTLAFTSLTDVAAELLGPAHALLTATTVTHGSRDFRGMIFFALFSLLPMAFSQMALSQPPEAASAASPTSAATVDIDVVGLGSAPATPAPAGHTIAAIDLSASSPDPGASAPAASHPTGPCAQEPTPSEQEPSPSRPVSPPHCSSPPSPSSPPPPPPPPPAAPSGTRRSARVRRQPPSSSSSELLDDFPADTSALEAFSLATLMASRRQCNAHPVSIPGLGFLLPALQARIQLLFDLETAPATAFPKEAAEAAAAALASANTVVKHLAALARRLSRRKPFTDPYATDDIHAHAKSLLESAAAARRAHSSAADALLAASPSLLRLDPAFGRAVAQRACRLLASSSASWHPPVAAGAHPTTAFCPLFWFPFSGSGAVSIGIEEVGRIASNQMLNDSAIDFYLKYLAHDVYPLAAGLATGPAPAHLNHIRLPEVFIDSIQSSHDEAFESIPRAPATPPASVHIFNTFFFTRLSKLLKNGQPLTLLSQSLRRVDLLQRDFWVIPVNHMVHWLTVVVCYPGRLLECPDYLAHFDPNGPPQRGRPAPVPVPALTRRQLRSRQEAARRTAEVRRAIDLAADHLRTSPAKPPGASPDFPTDSGGPAVALDLLAEQRASPDPGTASSSSPDPAEESSLDLVLEDAVPGEASPPDTLSEEELHCLTSYTDTYTPFIIVLDSLHDHRVTRSTINPVLAYLDFMLTQSLARREAEAASEPASSKAPTAGSPAPGQDPSGQDLASQEAPRRPESLQLPETFVLKESITRMASCVSFRAVRLPLQSNLTDCGIFLLQYIENFLAAPRLYYLLAVMYEVVHYKSSFKFAGARSSGPCAPTLGPEAELALLETLLSPHHPTTMPAGLSINRMCIDITPPDTAVGAAAQAFGVVHSRSLLQELVASSGYAVALRGCLTARRLLGENLRRESVTLVDEAPEQGSAPALAAEAPITEDLTGNGDLGDSPATMVPPRRQPTSRRRAAARWAGLPGGPLKQWFSPREIINKRGEMLLVYERMAGLFLHQHVVPMDTTACGTSPQSPLP